MSSEKGGCGDKRFAGVLLKGVMQANAACTALTDSAGVLVDGSRKPSGEFATRIVLGEIWMRGTKPWDVVDFPIIKDQRGNLTFIEGNSTIPFPIARVYYLYDVPGGAHRGGHAHKDLEQIIIAASGSFDVHLDDGHKKQTVSLNRSYYGLFMRNMVWRELDNFSSGAICLVLASRCYDESDYIRDYTDFIKAVRAEESAKMVAE